MAKELAPKGIRVNSVSPGLIGQTAFHARFTAPEAFAAVEKTIPIGRAGTPEEVGRVIAFLSGPDAAYLVGRDRRGQRRDAHAMTPLALFVAARMRETLR